MTDEGKAEAAEVIGFQGGSESILCLVPRHRYEALNGPVAAKASDLERLGFVPVAQRAEKAEARVAELENANRHQRNLLSCIQAEAQSTCTHDGLPERVREMFAALAAERARVAELEAGYPDACDKFQSQLRSISAQLAAERAGREHLERASRLLQCVEYSHIRDLELREKCWEWLRELRDNMFSTPAPPSEGPASPVAGNADLLELAHSFDKTGTAAALKLVANLEAQLRAQAAERDVFDRWLSDAHEKHGDSIFTHVIQAKLRALRSQQTSTGEAKEADMVKLLVETVEEAGGKITFDPKRTNRPSSVAPAAEWANCSFCDASPFDPCDPCVSHKCEHEFGSVFCWKCGVDKPEPPPASPPTGDIEYDGLGCHPPPTALASSEFITRDELVAALQSDAVFKSHKFALRALADELARGTK